MHLPRLAHTRPTLFLILASITVHLLTTVLLLPTSLLPAWDRSSLDLTQSRAIQPYLRWDTVYFLKIAHEGYTVEQRAAFMPGLPWLMREGGKLMARLAGDDEVSVVQYVVAGMVASGLGGVGAVVALYQYVSRMVAPPCTRVLTRSLALRSLTLTLFHSKQHALITSLLYLIPPSPPTALSVPYNEPIAACTTFLGMLAFARKQHLLAALAWSLGTAFRAQGIVLGVGFFGWWYLLERPVLRGNGQWSFRVSRSLPSGISQNA